MYFLYLDDSGSPKNKDEDYFVLGGFIIHETKLYWLNKHLDELAEKISPSFKDTIEFHASEIYSAKSEPWKNMLKQERISIIKSVLDVVQRESKNISVVACAVKKNNFQNEDPVKLAFKELCSRFDLFLKRKYHNEQKKDQGIIIFDESSHETSIQELSKKFRTIGTEWGVISNIQEVPLFVNSKASRGIQLADHIAYSVFRRYQKCDLNYFNIIENCIDADETRMHGLVHRTTEICTCPACLTRRFVAQHSCATDS